MRRRQDRRLWKTGTIVALAAVVGLASPAAAAVQSTTTVTASPPAASVGAPVVLTTTVTCDADPSGALLGVTLFDGANILKDGVPVGADGQAEYTAVFTTTGTHTITAAYNGNENCFASHDTTTVEVSAAPVPPTNGQCSYNCVGPINVNVSDINNDIDTQVFVPFGPFNGGEFDSPVVSD